MNENPFRRPVAPVAAVPPPAARPSRPRSAKNVWLIVAAVLLVFLLGLVPMWMRAARIGRERDAAWRQARALGLETLVAAGTIDAQRGQYDLARENVSLFFRVVREELDRGSDSVLSPAQLEQLRQLAVGRDYLIALLTRRNPVAAQQVTELYMNSRRILRGG